MLLVDELPEPPLFHIEVLDERPLNQANFLRISSRLLNIFATPDKKSAPFVYDEVRRQALDAVVIVPHFMSTTYRGLRVRRVVLRSALRPPLALRNASRSPHFEPENRGLWEVPAGLVEADESSPLGLKQAAARELGEEAGFLVEQDELRPLGPSAFPAPGMIAERQFFFEVEVDPLRQKSPSLDGSPLEEAGQLIAVPLSVALAAAKQGRLADSKTELALRRLHDVYARNDAENAEAS